MDQKVKAKWVAALRSGDYEQTAETLACSDGSGFCCLGVLCAVYAQEHDIASVRDLCSDEGELPCGDVVRWADLPDEDPRLVINGKRDRASVHNDGVTVEKKSFTQIADAIEAQL